MEKEKNSVLLNDSQMGVFLDCADDVDNLKYNITCEWEFPLQKIDKNKLKNAFKNVIKNHKSFRTAIVVKNGTPYMQEIEGENAFEEKNMTEKEYQTFKNTFAKPFLFDGNFMYRVCFVYTEKNIHVMLDIHHLLFDGTSFTVFNRELKNIYEGKEVNKEETDLFMQSKLDEQKEQSEEVKKCYQFYDNYLADIDSDSRFIPDIINKQDEKNKMITDFVTTFTNDKLSAFAKNINVTENIMFAGAFAYALAKFTAQNDVVFSSVESGRHKREDLNFTTGMFVTTFPVRIKIEDDIKVVDYLQYVKESFFSSMKNDKAPFVKLATKYGVTSTISYVYQGELLNDFKIDEQDVKVDVIESKHAIGDFDIMIFKENGKYTIRCITRKSMYSQEYVESIARTINKCIEEFLVEDKMSQVLLVDDKQIKQIEKFNATETNYDDSKTAVDLLEEQVKKYPNNIAVAYNDKMYTYAEFDKITNKIANYIVNKGLGKDDFVAVLIGRSEFMPLTAWGVVKSGVAYQPLDSSYPVERLNFMVNDSKAKLLIVDRELKDLLTEYKGDVLYTDEIEKLTDTSFPNVKISPNNAFIIIYTSGTTGTPKGCVLEHKNIVCFSHNHARIIGLNQSSRVAQYASFGFDASVMDIFPTLMNGASLYIIPEAIRLDFAQIDEFYAKNKITNGFMTTQVGRMFAERTTCKTLKTMMIGGEKLVPFNPPKNLKVINAYGPSETMVYVNHFEIKDDSVLQPIGKANDDTKFYVVDKNFNLMPIGACGELCVAGNQVARGYLGREDKTKEVFVANKFSKQKGYERIYRTGDIVRLLPDGNFDFVGRKDGQVKIRGFRIELTEVEQIIRAYKGIENATVQAFSDASGGKYLVAYITSTQKIDIEDVKSFILKEKPAYMVPAVIMQIDSIPINVNGKVDKKKLPIPQIELEDVIPPKTQTEKKIFEIVAKIIGTNEFGANTNLFSIGLSSIGCLKLNVEILDCFNVPIQMRNVKECGNIINLAKFVEENKTTIQTETKESYPDYPITKTQEGIYIECLSNPSSTMYNIPILLKLYNSISLSRLKSAIVQAVQAHNYMNTTLFTDKNGSVRQKQVALASFGRDDITETKVGNLEEIKDKLVKPFELLNSRLFRIEIIKTNDCNYLFMDFHHIICDGTSLNIFIANIEDGYLGKQVKEEQYTGFDNALEEIKQRNSTALDDAEEYYTALLDGLDTDFLPRPDLYDESKQGSGKLCVEGKENFVCELKKYLENNNLSANAFFCSAFGYVLSLYNGTEYSVFTTVYNGRNDARLNNTFSMLVKTLPVVSSTSNSIEENISSISKQLMNSMANDIFSFAEISHKFELKNDVMFIFQGDNFEITKFCNAPTTEIKLSLSKEKAPLTVQAIIRNDKVVYDVEYDNMLFSDEFIESFIKTLDRVANQFIKNKTIDSINLIDDAQLKQLEKFNATEKTYDDTKNVVDILNEQVKKYPNNVAVVYKQKTYTYSEFDKITNKLANYIVSKKIGKDDFVAILVGRNEFMPLTAWGVVKAGAGYQPLDPTYPVERLNFMVNDSKAKLLIADRELKDLLTEYKGEVLYTDEIEKLKDLSSPNVKISPNNALIIIYTSGTTGTPKGCVLEHKNIVCFNYNHTKIMDIDNTSKIAQYASFGFDAGVMDIFTTLMTGATLCIIPEEIRLDLSLIDEFYKKNNITHGFMTTQVGRMFAEKTTCKTLKALLLGGEKLVPFNPPKNFKVINGYGPSETIAYVSHFDIKNGNVIQPIGVPSDNTKLYVVDKKLNLLPIGACGELCISGNQVGRGYLGREDKTKEVFVPNKFSNKKGYERIYRTGDIVRLLPDGNYDFVGRKDGQVKIRGFRIELTEVEQIIRNYEGVENATVQAFSETSGGKYLVAYITSKKKIDIDDVKAFILREKPAYMVPAVIMQIDTIPINVNGKVDKKKLPVPQRNQTKGVEPSTEDEKKICELYAEVLGIEKVYANEDFFDLGGTSISALELIVKLENAGYNVVFKNIFENTTPQQLASFISGATIKKTCFAPTGEDYKKHNYTPLEYNIIDNLDKISTKDVGNVLLTGVTGFLGSHVFIDLLNNTKGKIICIIRDKKGFSPEQRLNTILEYYFERTLTEKDKKRVVIIASDITDENLEGKLKKYKIDTILNCAANVKHFGNEDDFMKDNLKTVDVLIKIAKQHNATLVHASSLSVSGESVDNHIPKDFVFAENNLNIGQSLENLYCRSKYYAEEKIIDEISKGLNAKIIRFGNLMARSPDGEFQINNVNSGFLRLIKGYAVLGCYPVEALDMPIEFSPIDCSARAMILLAGTPKEFTCFHANNCHHIHYANVFEVLNKIGIKVDFVRQEEFAKRYKELLDNPDNSKDYSGLLAYKNNNDAKGKIDNVKTVPQKNDFTTKALYMLGFSWPIIDFKYLELLLKLQKESGFFDL